MEYQEIDYWLLKHGIKESFGNFMNPSFWTNDTEKSMASKILDLLLEGFAQKKEPFITLFAICVLFGILSQVAIAFERNELKSYGYFIHYICCVSICLKLFMEGYELVKEVLGILLSFMQVLTPTYCFSILCSSGSMKAITNYGLLMLGMFLVQVVIAVTILPAVKFLMAIHFANAATSQKMFGKISQLMETGISTVLKTIVGMISGWQIVKSLLVPGTTQVGEGVRAVISLIPGIGHVAQNTWTLFQGAASTMKNCMGAGGIIILTIIAIPPIITLLVYVLGFKLLEAMLQPMVQEQLTTLFSGSGVCMLLLLKIVIAAYLLFSISLCILTTLV